MQETKNIIKSMSIHMLHITEQGCLITQYENVGFYIELIIYHCPRNSLRTS